MAKLNKSAGGIGESKVFCAPEETRLRGHVDRILACHIDGKPVAEMNLSPQVLSALAFEATDEGLAEATARPGPKSSGVTLGKDEWDKALKQRIADIKERGMVSYQARDPMKEVADKYAQPGMKAKFLSRKKITENGGTGDYDVVKDKNGDPVSVKGMILGHTPVELADARNKHYQDKAAKMLSQVTQKFVDDTKESAVVDA
jgi:hypothetical protein